MLSSMHCNMLMYRGTIKINHYSIRKNERKRFYVDIDIQARTISTFYLSILTNEQWLYFNGNGIVYRMIKTGLMKQNNFSRSENCTAWYVNQCLSDMICATRQTFAIERLPRNHAREIIFCALSGDANRRWRRPIRRRRDNGSGFGDSASPPTYTYTMTNSSQYRRRRTTQSAPITKAEENV